MPDDLDRVRTVFVAAVGQADPGARTAVLDRECGDDPSLRRQVESLLEAHTTAEMLLERQDSGADGTRPDDTAVESVDSTVARPPTTHVGPAARRERPAASTAAEGAGSRIGPYRLVEKIGEGGMGTVYLAEQEKPVRRRVALKIIKPGSDTDQVVARFEAERQALAMMDHPNIAHVLDAGTTETGRPYFVMELVHGVPITDYCDQARLTPRERLELFVPVCEAIQHAHQKGIIHRDIKPSNVLVTMYDGRPSPKVIDFGIAKATDQTLTERTMFTQYGVIVGTLEYMSPEQATVSMQDVDTRSDIYSLGVVLYELLTGTTPLKRAALRDAGFAEILKRIKDEDPPRPSTRLVDSKEALASMSALRKTEPAKLARLLRGDLDWIVMKALEKDRDRRYETASGFARDVRRYLDGDAVEARPPTTGYRLAKFARKNRGVLTAAAAMAGLLLVGTVVSTWQALRATHAERLAEARLRDVSAANGRTEAALTTARKERDVAVAERERADAQTALAKSEGEKAERSAAEARAVLGFFEDRVLAAARPQGQRGGLGKDVTLRAAVDAAEPTIAAAFRDKPTVEAYIRDSLGTTYRYLGEPSLTVRQHERALELRKAALGPDHPDTLASQNNLAQAYTGAARLDLAIPLLEQTLKARAAKLGADHRDTLATRNHLASAHSDAGRLDLAIPLYEQTLRGRMAGLGADHTDTLTSQDNLAVAYKNAGRLDRAIPLFERTLEAREKAFGADHPETLISQNNLAAAYKNSGRLDLALPLFEKTLAARTSRLGADHPNTLNSRNNLASAYRDAGQFDRAIPLLEQTLAARATKLGTDHPDALASQYSLALALKDAGRPQQAIALLERTLAARKSRLGPDHPDILKTQNNLALTYRDVSRFDRAIPLFEETLKVETSRLGADHPDTLTTRNNLALTYRDDGQWDRAIALTEQTLKARAAKLGADHPDTLLTQHNLAMAYREAGQWDRAIPIFERTLAAQTSKLGADHPYTLLTQNNLGPAYQAAGQVDRAIALLEQTRKARAAKLGADHPSTLSTQNNLALAYEAAGQRDRAIALFEETLAARTTRHGADNLRTLTTRYDLATAYQARGDSARAESMLRDVLAAREKALGPEHPAVAQTLTALGRNLLGQQKWADAEPLLRRALATWDAKRPDDWTRFDTRSLLGESLLGREKYAEAEPLLLSGFEGLKAHEAKLDASRKGFPAVAGERVVRLYEAWGKPEKAAECHQARRQPHQC